MVVIWFCVVSYAKPSFLHTLENEYFHYSPEARFGMEIEYRGVDPRIAAEIGLKYLGGKIVTDSNANGPVYVLKHTRIGDVKIKIETNQTGDGPTPEEEWVYEIVGPPATYSENALIQEWMDELLIHGATGAEDGTPVSIQTNAETGHDFSNISELRFEFQVMRNFYLNWEQVVAELNPLPNRMKYVQPPSPEMLKRMKDPSYQPSDEQILLDYVYRQSLELSGRPDVWNLSNAEVRSLAAQMNFPIVDRVVKLTAYRFSSLLLHHFPSDPYLKRFIDDHWTFSAPITEQRLRNNDFNILSAIRQIVGLKNATKTLGLFIYNRRTGSLETIQPFQCSGLF